MRYVFHTHIGILALSVDVLHGRGGVRARELALLLECDAIALVLCEGLLRRELLWTRAATDRTMRFDTKKGLPMGLTIGANQAA